MSEETVITNKTTEGAEQIVEAMADSVNSRIITIPRGPWEIDLDSVLEIRENGASVTVATSKGGFILTTDEAAPILADQAAQTVPENER